MIQFHEVTSRNLEVLILKLNDFWNSAENREFDCPLKCSVFTQICPRKEGIACFPYIHTHIYICVCVYTLFIHFYNLFPYTHTHTQTQTHTHIYMWSLFRKSETKERDERWNCIDIYAYVHAQSLKSCLTLLDTMDHSQPGSSVLGTVQARILEWVAMPDFGIEPMSPALAVDSLPLSHQGKHM